MVRVARVLTAFYATPMPLLRLPPDARDACRRDDPDALAPLLDALSEAQRARLLHTAAAQLAPGCVGLLLARGAHPDALAAGGPLRPLLAALQPGPADRQPDAEARRLAIARSLIDAGADLAAEGPYQHLDALRLAAAANRAALIAPLRATGRAAETPHAAAICLDAERLRAHLRAAPSALHARDSRGRTPLHHVAMSRLPDDARALDVARILLDAGARIDGTSPTARETLAEPPKPPLWWAVAFSTRRALAALLLQRGASPDGCVVQAAWNDDAPMLDLLLQHGADLEARSPRQHTPLHDALIFKRHDGARLLIRRGADPNARTPLDQTALHHAAATGAPEDLIRALLDAGADPNALDHTQRTPRDLARARHPDTASLLDRLTPSS